MQRGDQPLTSPRPRRFRGAVVVVGLLGVILAGLAGAFIAFYVNAAAEPGERAFVSVDAGELSVEEVDRTVALPLAEALAGAHPKARVEVVSRHGGATAILEVPGGLRAIDSARRQLAGITLPGAPVTGRIAPHFREVRWIVRGEDAAMRQRALARRIESMTGVSGVRSCGTPDAETHVLIDEARAAARAVTAVEVAEALRRADTADAAGRIEAAGPDSRVRVAPRDLETIADALVRDGIAVRDVATVSAGIAPGACRCVAGADEPACAIGAASFLGEEGIEEVTAAVRREGRGVVVLDEEKTITLGLRLPPGASLEDRTRMSRVVIAASRQLDSEAISVASVGAPETLRSPSVDLELVVAPSHRSDDEAAAQEHAERVRAAVLAVPGVAIGRADGPARVAILEGDDADVLADTAARIAAALRRDRVVRAAILDDTGREPELRITIDPVGVARYGLRPADVTAAIALAQAPDGQVVGVARTHDDAMAIRVLLAPPPSRTTPDPERIGRVMVSSGGASVPLGQLVRMEQAVSPGKLRRCGTQRCMRITVAVTPGEARSLDAVARSLRNHELPAGVTLRWDPELPLFPI